MKNIKLVVIFSVLYLLCRKEGLTQNIIEVGYQRYFLTQLTTNEKTSLDAINIGYGIGFGEKLPVYFTANMQRLHFLNLITESRDTSRYFIGIASGIRPFAGIGVFPLQPFIEGGYKHILYQQGFPLASIVNYGFGLEIYITHRHSVAFYYGIDQMVFGSNKKLCNTTAHISLRFNLASYE